MNETVLLPALIFLAALLYSSVGHAGASGYLAAMALFGLAPAEMRPAALVLNIIVATIGTIRFARVDCVDWRLVLLFAAGSVPCALLGGTLTLPTTVYRPVVGVILVLSSVRLVLDYPKFDGEKRPVPVIAAVACGAGIGLLSGLTGTGGGIFLSPILLFMRWADTKETAGISVAFILANSISGLTGLLSKGATLPHELPEWLIAATAGGLIGSEFGSKRLGNRTLRRLLALVLVIAGMKMILS